MCPVCILALCLVCSTELLHRKPDKLLPIPDLDDSAGDCLSFGMQSELVQSFRSPCQQIKQDLTVIPQLTLVSGDYF